MATNHVPRRTLRRTSATAAAIAMAATVLAVPSANALLSDNVHNQAGGGVNIHAENTCVEKIGDTAHVKFMVQHQPLVRSSDHGQTAAHGTLALPSAMKNVSIKLKAVGGTVVSTNKDTGEFVDEYRHATVFDTPLDIPIMENTAEYREKFPYGPPVLGGRQRINVDDKHKWGEDDPDSTPSSRREYSDPDNPELVYDSTVWTEQEVRDFVEKYNVHMKKTSQGFMDNNSERDTVPFMQRGSGDMAWYGTEYTKGYDSYEFGNVMMPVTFEVEGDVPVEQKDTFVTAAVSNLGWKSSMESYAGNYAMGSQSLQEYQWARPNQLPPAIPKTEDMIQLYRDKLSDAGLDISPTIAPTGEIQGDSKYAYIGSDTRPSARGDAGNNYARTFTLHANRAVTYIGQVDTSGEDGADITAAHVELCEAPPTTEKPTSDKPSTSETTSEEPTSEKPTTDNPTTSEPTSEKPTTSEPTPTTSEKPSGSSLDEETMKKVGLGLGLGLGGAALIEKVKEHRGGGSHTVNTTEPKPAPSTTAPAQATTTAPASATTTSPAPSAETTTSPAPATTTSPAPKGATGRLAETGANVVWLSAAGVLVLLAGAAFLIAGRRREE